MSVNLPKIIWIVTYPKSGTTWFRSIITALYNNGSVNINELIEETKYLEHRTYFDRYSDIPSEYLTLEEVYYYRPAFIEYLRRRHQFNRPLFIKTHETFHKIKHTYINQSNTLAIIYIIRNPLSIACSLADYTGNPIDKIIRTLKDNKKILKGKAPDILFPRPIGSWSNHVNNWITKPNSLVEVIKYEDLKLNPFLSLKSLFNKIGINFSDQLLRKTIDSTSFIKLKDQEIQEDYKDRPIKSRSFFRKGDSEGWRSELTKK